MKHDSVNPPRLFLRFFRWFCHPSLLAHIEGDLMELYHERIKAFGKRTANLKFIMDVLWLFRPGIVRAPHFTNPLNPDGMFKNYFRVGMRNILKYKTFSFINVFGLAAAMSVGMLIILMLSDQGRYDAFHDKKDRIYRILSDYETSKQAYATTPFPVAQALRSDYSLVEAATTLVPEVGGDGMYGLKTADMRGYFADPSFFRVFSFELEEGNAAQALSQPYSMVITKAMARKLFGDETPLGKTIEFSDRKLPFPLRGDGMGSPAVPWGSFTVTGVIDNSRYISHLQFDVLVSAATRLALQADNKAEDFSNNWGWFYRAYTYVVLPAGKTKEDLDGVLTDLVKHRYASVDMHDIKGFTLLSQPLGDVQLGLMGNDTSNRLPKVGYYFLYVLALVIMVSACLNYTNLSVARALTRAKEIGVRKVTGANRRALVYQFLSESILTSFLSLAMAVALLAILKPAFKSLWINKHLNFQLPFTGEAFAAFAAFALIVGIVAGVYPALYLSRFQPSKVLKDLGNVRPGRMTMRKVLGVSQFVVSLFFITTSILIFNQFKHFMTFDYGFSSHNILNVDLQGSNYEKLANEFRSIPGVAEISASDILPGLDRNNTMELRKPGGGDNDFFQAGIIAADEHFIGNLEVKLLAGKNLPAAAEGAAGAILVNAEFATRLGYRHPAEIVGEVFETRWGHESVKVIGVVENFRHKLLINEHGIAPLVLRHQPENFMYAQVKISSVGMKETVARLHASWAKLDPVHPLQYEFYDDQLVATHQGIFDLVSILGFIAFLAIMIACLGLLGMAVYTAERRKKEVGIRKVLGANGKGIALLLSREFVKILALAVAIGAPLSYVVNNLWLQHLPNRVPFGPGTVLLGTAILAVLGLITIGSQTLRAARANPVSSLRME